jgi:HPt (histidine-containing phosphotransfer) domain-containing protein
MASSALAKIMDQDRSGGNTASRPIIDLVHLSRQTCGDGALESELLRLFVNQAQQFATRLNEERLPGDGPWRADLAHRLKGSARAVGAFALGEAAEAYEEAARAEAPELAEAHRHLDSAIARARNAIAELL